MDVSEFQGLLEKGLGRAPIYLQDHDSSPYRHAILYACTHDQRYERWVEDCRAVYLMDIIRFSRDMAFYRSKILAALQEPAEDESAGQMFQIARLLAERGDAEARRVMIDTFKRHAAQGDFTGVFDLIELDGWDALIMAAGYLLGQADREDAVRDYHMWIGDLRERDGEQAMQQALAQAAEQHPEIAPLLEAMRAYEEKLEADRQLWRTERLPDYAILKQSIARHGSKTKRLRLWGRKADAEALRQAAADLMAEQDTDRLIAYLRIFQDRDFPLPFDRLLGLACSADKAVVHATANVLERIRHPDIRALALELSQSSERYRYGIQLLARNYQEGDYDLLESLLEKPLDTDNYHQLGIGARDFIEQNLTVEAERPLIQLYENSPCSFCRQFWVRSLMALGRLPEWMRAECRYDANPDIREMVCTKSLPVL
ncbi:MAG TPA: hypothetical protein VFA07_01410 [Chthonomonadaceae bacterium]|nr:hypothetical protein [Chthonomonadaceae bacterium]